MVKWGESVRAKWFGEVKSFFKEIFENEITVYSAQASYYIMISAFPLVMLFISLVGFVVPQYKDILMNAITSFVPSVIQPAIKELATELFQKSIPIVSLSAVTALWTSSRGIAAVARGVQRVYKTKKKKNFFITTLYSIIYTVAIILSLFLTLLLQVFGNTFFEFLNAYGTISPVHMLFIKGIFFITLVSVVFALAYFFLSKREIPLRKHFPGAIFSAVGWMGFSNLFSIYIENFANYSYIYGSLTAIVLLMLWLYCCVIILLTGAALNQFIQRKGKNE